MSFHGVACVLGIQVVSDLVILVPETMQRQRPPPMPLASSLAMRPGEGKPVRGLTWPPSLGGKPLCTSLAEEENLLPPAWASPFLSVVSLRALSLGPLNRTQTPHTRQVPLLSLSRCHWRMGFSQFLPARLQNQSHLMRSALLPRSRSQACCRTVG